MFASIILDAMADNALAIRRSAVFCAMWGSPSRYSGAAL